MFVVLSIHENASAYHYQISFTLNRESGENGGQLLALFYDEQGEGVRAYEFSGQFKAGQKYTYLIKSDSMLPVARALVSYKNFWNNFLESKKVLQLQSFNIKYMSHIDYS